MIKGQVSSLHIGVLIILSIIISSHVDNVPWTAILIAVLSTDAYPMDCIQWKMLVIALGLAGALSPVGSTSTLVASSLLGVGFKDFYKESLKIIILIVIVMGVTYAQYLIF
jgi:Na+/H+ antiporter NhaD/arsenite permease-like protein